MEHIRYAVAVPEVDPSTYGMPGYIQPLRKPRTDSSSNPQKRTDPFQFGSRYLEEGDNIFDHNAWDHVETDETYRIFAEEQYKKQREVPVTEFDKSMCMFARVRYLIWFIS
jgi:tRNAThr (cytosine32-N3)-methyltransferase